MNVGPSLEALIDAKIDAFQQKILNTFDEKLNDAVALMLMCTNMSLDALQAKIVENFNETMTKQVHVLKTMNVRQPSVRLLPDAPASSANSEPNDSANAANTEDNAKPSNRINTIAELQTLEADLSSPNVFNAYVSVFSVLSIDYKIVLKDWWLCLLYFPDWILSFHIGASGGQRCIERHWKEHTKYNVVVFHCKPFVWQNAVPRQYHMDGL